MQAQMAAAVAEWMPGPITWLLVWLLKGSLLLALLFPVATLLRRYSSSTRHTVWTAGLAVTLALPLVSTGVLPWRLELPLAPVLVASLSTSADAVDGSNEVVGDALRTTTIRADASGETHRIERTAPSGRADLTESPSLRDHAGTISLDGSGNAVVSSSSRSETTTMSPTSTRAGADRRASSAVGWMGIGVLQFAVLLWAAGAAVLLVRLGRSAMHARRLVRNGTPLSGSAWTTPLIEAADRLDLPDLPRLLMNMEATVPLTCGIVRPSIVLPPSSEAWTDERRRAVLCHELSHIRRRDLTSHLLGRLTCALYWFQPLAWSAARRMRAESERACDDLVLLTGTRASAYADHLLEIAAAGRGGAAPAVALPMAQPREFEARLLSILEPDKRREPLSRVQAAVLAGLVLILAQPLVALTPVRTAPPQPAVADGPRNDVYRQDPVSPGSDHDSGPAMVASDTASSNPSDSAGPSVDDGSPRTSPPADISTITVASDTGRRERPQSFERGIERGAEMIAESVTDVTVSTIGQVFQSLAGLSGQEDPRVRDGLIDALSDPAPEVRRTAAWSLSTHSDSLVVQALAQALRSDEDARVREMSVWALAQLDAAQNDIALEALSDALVSDASTEVRAAAAWALGDTPAAAAVSALQRAVQSDTAAEVREAAAWALGNIEAASSVAALSAAMAFENADVRETAAWALGNIEPDRAPGRLVAGLRDPAPDVRKATVWALGRIEDPETAAALQEALSDDDAEVRSAVIWALGRLPNAAATEALTAALRDPDPEVRAAAAAALGGHGSHPWPWPRPRPRPRPQP